MIRKNKPAIVEEHSVRRGSLISDAMVEELSELRTQESTDVELAEKTFLPSASTAGRFEPRMIDEIRHLARFGHTNVEICNFFGVSIGTWYKWMRLYPEMQRALYEGREEDGMRIVDSLHKQAVGYEIEEVQKEYYINKEGVKTLKVERIVKKAVLPNVKAGMYLLKTRFPNKWTETTRVETKSTIDVNVSQKLDLSDLSTEELLLMKKLGMKSIPETASFRNPVVQTINIPEEDVA